MTEVATVHNDDDGWRPESGPDVDAWKACSTWEEGGELTAQWLEGKRSFQPRYMGASPDSESSPLIAVLARINRLGFFTDQSQPGVPIEDGCGQRAFVSGYCSETMAAVVSAKLLGSELVAIVIPPGGSSGGQICVTVDDGEEFTWVGIAGTSYDAADEYFPDTNMTFASLLSERWQMQIFDARWGRKDLLWELLIPAVEKAAAMERGLQSGG